jgi:hypothetical protein
MDDADPRNFGIPSAPYRIQRRRSTKITPAFRVPSPTTLRRRSSEGLHPSTEARVPSPPPSRRTDRVPRASREQRVPSPATVRRRVSFHGGYEFRVPSPPTIRRKVSPESLVRVRPTGGFRVPSPPLNQRPEGQRKGRRGFSNNALPTIRGVSDY